MRNKSHRGQNNSGPTQRLQQLSDTLARGATTFVGSTAAFVIALSAVILWFVLGPVFGFSDSWQLVINTGTTIVTFLMVFLIQRFQNRDSLAIQVKLDELVAALTGASNRLINVEDLSQDELDRIVERYRELAALAKNERDPHGTHSIDEPIASRKRARRPGRNGSSRNGAHAKTV